LRNPDEGYGDHSIRRHDDSLSDDSIDKGKSKRKRKIVTESVSKEFSKSFNPLIRLSATYFSVYDPKKKDKKANKGHKRSLSLAKSSKIAEDNKAKNQIQIITNYTDTPNKCPAQIKSFGTQNESKIFLHSVNLDTFKNTDPNVEVFSSPSKIVENIATIMNSFNQTPEILDEKTSLNLKTAMSPKISEYNGSVFGSMKKNEKRIPEFQLEGSNQEECKESFPQRESEKVKGTEEKKNRKLSLFSSSNWAAEKTNENNVNDTKAIENQTEQENVTISKNHQKAVFSPEQAESLGQIDELCSICCDKPSNCVFMPCGHGGLCEECSLTLLIKNKNCHLCQKVFLFYSVFSFVGNQRNLPALGLSHGPFNGLKRISKGSSSKENPFGINYHARLRVINK
jgi:Zinc finger, C3HC4 type (RING finger)